MGRNDAPSAAEATGGSVAVERHAVDVDAGGDFGERRRGCYERAHGAEHFHAGAAGIEAFEGARRGVVSHIQVVALGVDTVDARKVAGKGIRAVEERRIWAVVLGEYGRHHVVLGLVDSEVEFVVGGGRSCEINAGGSLGLAVGREVYACAVVRRRIFAVGGVDEVCAFGHVGVFEFQLERTADFIVAGGVVGSHGYMIVNGNVGPHAVVVVAFVACGDHGIACIGAVVAHVGTDFNHEAAVEAFHAGNVAVACEFDHFNLALVVDADGLADVDKAVDGVHMVEIMAQEHAGCAGRAEHQSVGSHHKVFVLEAVVVAVGVMVVDERNAVALVDLVMYKTGRLSL